MYPTKSKKQHLIQSLKLNNHIEPASNGGNEQIIKQNIHQNSQLPLLNAIQSQIISSNVNFVI